MNIGVKNFAENTESHYDTCIVQRASITRTDMDIVYLLKNTPINEELIYSLRTLKNLPHSKVFLVGGCPNTIRKENIVHIPVLQRPNKYKNTTLSLELACRDSRLSQDFILMNDDFFVLQRIENPKNALNLFRGTLEEVLQDYSERYGTDANHYILGMRQTNIFLKDLGIEKPLSYELHIPFVMNKHKVLEMLSLPYINSLKVIHKRTIYGNLFLKYSKQTDDVKILRDIYLPVHNDQFLSSEDASWPYVKTYIGRKFKEKSIYEI